MKQPNEKKDTLKSYEKLSAEETIKKLNTDAKSGLTTEEVQKRVKVYGLNEIEEKKVNPVVKLIKKFWGPTPWMLEITIIISYFLQKYVDLYVIFALLMLNAIISFVQELKAQNALQLLKKQLQVNSRVVRNGKWGLYHARELVPGDVVRVRQGDFVPADIKIIEGKVEVDQSALTGESQAVIKEDNNILYSGSTIKHGEVSGVVLFTGVDTFFGKTTELVQTASPKLHMQDVISNVVKWLIAIVGVTLSIVVVVSVIRGINIINVLPLILVLLVSAIPVALPAMFTITMALGSLEMAKKGILITRLSASEDAASMDTVCSDKTGTITMNKLIVSTVIPVGDYRDVDVIRYGSLASNESTQDSIDIAFLNYAAEKKVTCEEYTQKKYIPFDPAKRSTEALIEYKGKIIKVSKGAVNELSKRCANPPDVHKNIMDNVTNLAVKGFRTLAVAIEEDNVSKFVGIAALYDAPRKDSKQMVTELNNLGISVKMLTGDSEPVAKEIASEVGIGDRVLRVSSIRDDLNKGTPGVVESVKHADIFAEIYPEDKYTLVKTLQASGHLVGMTGDGVNDAPALKQAEVGIAVSSATDVAKGAASVVLTTEGLAKIVDFIKTGRKIYQRIVTWTLNKIIKTFQIVLFVSLAFLITGMYIASAFDIVLILFAVDFVTLSLSTDNVRWSRKPDKWDITGLTKIAIIIGILVVIESFVILYAGFDLLHLHNINKINTYTFEILFYSGMFTLLIVRERGHFWKSVPSTPLLVTILIDMAVIAIISTVGFSELTGIPLIDTITVIGLSLLFSLLLNDIIKYELTKKLNLSW